MVVVVGIIANNGGYVIDNIEDGKTCEAKTVIEGIDAAKKSITFRIIEGDVLEHYKSFRATIQGIPNEKGSVAHRIFEYEKVHAQIPDPHSLMQPASEISRDINAQLSQGQGHEDQLSGKVEVDVHIDASADKFNEILSSRPHHIPNISPGNIQNAIVEGSWGKVGSVIVWHYIHDKHLTSSCKCIGSKIEEYGSEVIRAIDGNKNLITLRAVEGDTMKDFKSMDITLQATPKDKGSVVRVTLEYERLKGHVPDPHTLTQLRILPKTWLIQKLYAMLVVLCSYVSPSASVLMCDVRLEIIHV
ncbi:MLP-like protein 28 [Prosopis cineraria]|uniref:MLP-like protein 28 n=1 Tax=Prosopis cineraria TaxID=364024 RepID=UPI00240F5DFC|nr:MLP-like protein 28 [Prosopis cineraria]